MSNKYFLKKGDRISIGKYEEYEYEGILKQITPYFISIQSLSPLRCVISRVVPKTYRKDIRLAFKTDGKYHATQSGVNTALDLLMIISHEENFLLRDQFRLKNMLEEYHQMELELDRELFYELDELRESLKKKYFPDLKQIKFDNALMCKLQKYVHKNS